jgi:GH25 family lysozyme M1 (1,4-beta-N-acetylmuramidase)
MQMEIEPLPVPRSYQQEVLQEMYQSPEPLNEGLQSFEYALYLADDDELDHFLGSVVRSVSKSVKGVAKAAGGVAKTVGKGLSAVDKIVPMSLLTSGLSMSPLGMAARAGLGAVQAAADGKNVFQGAVRSLASTPVARFYVDTAMAAARGENVLKAMQKAAQGQIGDLRKSLQFAAMVAPFIPGIGTGVAAALGAANALAAGQPITDALIAAARSAVPGGAIAQVAFDTAMNMAKGKNIGDALLNSARSQLPGGPAAQAAFDGALALAKGRSIQDAAFAATGRLLPPSPYAADALSFVKKVASGQNIQKAALSTAGNIVLNNIERQAGSTLQRARAAVPVNLPRQWPTRFSRRPAIRFARRPIPGRLPVRTELMQELSPQPVNTPRFSQLVRAGKLNQAIAETVQSGVSDTDRISDMVFYARHPELGGRKLRPNENSLAQEWLQIRATLVRPAIARVQGVQSAGATAVPSGPSPLIQKPSLLGLDTFGLDGNKTRDWTVAKNEAAISFAIFRSNWGASPDTAFPREWQRMKDAGLVRGAFLFLRFPHPEVDRKYGAAQDPVTQATAVTKALPLASITRSDLAPSLDVEFPGGRAKTGMTAQRCLEYVRAAWRVLREYYGVAPIIYTSARVWHEDLLDLPAPDLTESPLWLAYYPFKKGPARRDALVNRISPPVPIPWGDSKNWWIHQYQGDAIGLPGFAPGNVDMNRFNPMMLGAIGDRVRWVQRRLALAQSGTFDPATEAALRAFQRRNGLAPSGTIDPQTFAQLCWSNP